MFLLAAALFSLVMTSLIGNTVALSRLFYSVAKDDILPDRFAELNQRRNRSGPWNWFCCCHCRFRCWAAPP